MSSTLATYRQPFSGASSNTHLPYSHEYPARSVDTYPPSSAFDGGGGLSTPTHPKPSFSELSLADDLEVQTEEGTTHELYRVAPLPGPTGGAAPEEPKGFWKSMIPKSMALRLYLLVVLIETIVDLGIEGNLIVRVNELRKTRPNDSNLKQNRTPVYLGIFALAHVFQLVLAADAVWQRNTLQFVFLTVFNALFLLYAVIQISEVRDIAPGLVPVQVLTAAIPVVVSVAEIIYIALGWRIWSEFGWRVYKLLGADRQIKRLYMHYQIFQTFLRFDVFFWLGFSIQLIALVLKKSDFEYYLTIAALPLCMLLLLQGHLAAKYENKWMMCSFFVGCLGALGYFSYKLVRIYQQRAVPPFIDTYKSLSVFAAISIIMIILTFVWTVIVWRNFGQGLQLQMEKKKNQTLAAATAVTTATTGTDLRQTRHQRNPSRMSID
jgi:hypothetical protein